MQIKEILKNYWCLPNTLDQQWFIKYFKIKDFIIYKFKWNTVCFISNKHKHLITNEIVYEKFRN